VDGEAYDMERWGQYFKPAGMGQATGDPVAKSVPTSSVEEDDEPAAQSAPKAEAPAASSESASRAQDILAMIRNRQK
jgi:hypothetical protein